MADAFDIDQVIERVRLAAEESGAFIVPSMLSNDGTTLPMASVDAAMFPDLIRHVKPRIVYLLPAEFDAREAILESLETEDEAVLQQVAFRKLETKWRPRNGQTFRAFVGLACEGIVHAAIEDADWFEEFTDDIEAVSHLAEQYLGESARKLEETEKKRIAPMVAKLRGDPRFSGTKVGVAKRTILARSLFPNADDDTIRQIVDLAEGEHWLATSGR